MQHWPVTFLHPFPEQLAAAERIDPDSATSGFNLGADIWIVQTYLRLKQAGWEVRLSATLPPSGVVVFHMNPAALELLAAERAAERKDLVLVLACADRIRFPPADLYIVQNQHYLDRPRTAFVPHWPQPGLLHRHQQRRERLETLSYKGYSVQLHEMFRSESWQRGLAELGVRWAPDEEQLDQSQPAALSQKWADYSAVDAVLAVRVDLQNAWTNKPASKLVNAWMAGVPALLGPEQPYRELRRSPLDYFEVRSVAEALSAVARLKTEPGLYTAMVENGWRRAEAFRTERVTQIWHELLFATIPARIASGELPLTERLPWDVTADFAGWLGAAYPIRLI